MTAHRKPVVPVASVAMLAFVSACYAGAGGSGGPDDGGTTGGAGTGADGADSGGDPSDPDEPFETSLFECDPTQVPTDLPLRRLSRRQYTNALGDLVARLVPDDAEAVLAAAGPRLGLIPGDARSGPDPTYGGFTRLDQSIFQETVEGSYYVGAAIGKAIADDPARLGAAAGSCATDGDAGNDGACLDAFVRSFAPRVLRRPLTEEDVAFYVDVAGDTLEREDYADVIAVLLAAPGFLYFVEQGEPGTDGPRTPLDPYELASRLSFHFWQSIPDDALVEAAERGDLSDDELYAAQVERMFRDPRTERAVAEFYGEWLDPPHLAELDAGVGMPDYDAFLDGFVPDGETRAHMLDEIEQMGAYYTLGVDAPFVDWFRSDRSFARTEDLASIYGVPVWSDGEPPQLPPERDGVLTRAAVLATGSAMTHPVIKGVFTRKTLMCDPVPDPPADAMAVAMEIEDAALGARARAEAISEARPDCAGCHTGLINPLGYVTENFDALGRLRQTEMVFDKATGAVLAEVPIDTLGTPNVDGADDRTASNAAELNALMLETDKPQACFARRYFRFTFGRVEDDTTDGCTLAVMHQALLDGDDLGVIVRDIAMRPDFRTKTFEGGE
jgi:hypothetical protein